MKKLRKVLCMMLVAVLALSATVATTTIDASAAKKATIKAGKTFTVGKLKYKVTSVDGKQGSVTLIGTKNKKLTSVSLPETVKSGKYTFTITEIGSSAFKNCTKLTKVETNTELEKIGANAFSGCSKLETIDIQSTALTSVGANALKGISKNAVISTATEESADLLDGKGQKAGVTINGGGMAEQADATKKAEEAKRADLEARKREEEARRMAEEAEKAQQIADEAAKKAEEAKKTMDAEAAKKAEEEAKKAQERAKMMDQQAKEAEDRQKAAAEKAEAEAKAAKEAAEAAKKAEEARKAAEVEAARKEKEARDAEEAKKSEEQKKAEQKSKEQIQADKCNRLGHDWSKKYTTEFGNCTEPGVMFTTCTRCGARGYEKSVKAPGHSWGDWKTTKEATCGTEGQKTRTCKICHGEESQEIPAKGEHKFTQWIINATPTCTNDGSRYKKCAKCGQIDFSSYDPIPALGGSSKQHNWTEWKVVTPATCTTNGSETRECSTCGLKETQQISMTPHNWVEEPAKTMTAPCGGVYTVIKRTCATCGREGNINSDPGCVMRVCQYDDCIRGGYCLTHQKVCPRCGRN